jgi:hypothetical protein
MISSLKWPTYIFSHDFALHAVESPSDAGPLGISISAYGFFPLRSDGQLPMQTPRGLSAWKPHFGPEKSRRVGSVRSLVQSRTADLGLQRNVD